MPTSDQYTSVLGIVNEVERKLATNESGRLDSTKFTKLLVDLLNDVIDECNDYGDWPQMFRETTATVSSSVGSYEIVVSGQMKNVYDIRFDTDISPLRSVDIAEIRRLQRTRMFGRPRHFATVDVSGSNQNIRLSPIPGANENNKALDIAYYKKERLYTTVTADSSAVVMFPSRMLVQGTYAKALLEESGQQGTPQYQVAYQEYIRMRQEAYNRMRGDQVKEVTFRVR